MYTERVPTAEDVFTYPTISEVLKEEAGSTYISFHYRVFGFWSSSPLSFTIRRNAKPDGAEWFVTMSHSSGGRDDKQVECDIRAHENFAMATMHAVMYAKSVLAMADMLEHEYQQKMARNKAEAEVAEKKRQLLLEANPAIGMDEIKRLIQNAKDNAVSSVVVFSGSDRVNGKTYTFALSHRSGRYIWSSGSPSGSQVSAADALRYMSDWKAGSVTTKEL